MLTDWQGRPVLDWAERWGVPFLEVHRQVSSTNDVLLEMNEVERVPYGVVIADEQTAGRGRNNTTWYSPDGTGLLMSILLPLVSVAQPYISLILGLAVAQTIEVLGNSVLAQIKWPNDVLLDGAKVAGVLCESSGGCVVAGIGVNIRTPKDGFPSEFSARTSSLEKAFQVELEPSYVAEVLISKLLMLKPIFDHPLDVDQLPSEFHKELSSRDALAGSYVTTQQEGEGIACGINQKGALILKREDGSRVPVISGSVALV